MDQPAVQDEIRSFLTRTFLFEFGPEVNAGTDLFDAGLIDSYGFIELVKFLEQTYGISLSDDDLGSKEISTLRGIAQLVSDRRPATRRESQQVP
jgi:D-alanine--poly(phosphoribitol) ligase subunit 2